MEGTSAGAFQSMAAGKWRADGIPEHGEGACSAWELAQVNTEPCGTSGQVGRYRIWRETGQFHLFLRTLQAMNVSSKFGFERMSWEVH